MKGKASGVSLMLVGVITILLGLLVFFYSSSRFPTFAVSAVAFQASLAAVVFGIIGWCEEEGASAKVCSGVSIVGGTGFVLLTIVLVWKGSGFGT